MLRRNCRMDARFEVERGGAAEVLCETRRRRREPIGIAAFPLLVVAYRGGLHGEPGLRKIERVRSVVHGAAPFRANAVPVAPRDRK
jgi:hypothetical protein